MLRVCVIGMGPIGNLHARLYQEGSRGVGGERSPDLTRLVGVCDRDRDRLDLAVKRLSVPGFDDAAKMLRELKPDICGICTGGHEYGSDHYEPTMQALEAGCHVLGEKPISNNIAQGEQMVARAKEKNLCYGINLNHRFTPAARLAKRWQTEGRLGHLLFINMSMWIKNLRESSPYFHIKALHPHTVDIMRYFGGDIQEVHCFAVKAPGRSIWSTAQFGFRFANGALGALTGSYDIERGHPMERCEVGGAGGRVVIDDMWREATLYPADEPVKQVYTNPIFGGYRDFDDTFADRIHTFARQVARGTAPAEIDGSAWDALAAQKVLAAAIQSIETQSVIKVVQ